jgi:hypothetical protein
MFATLMSRSGRRTRSAAVAALFVVPVAEFEEESRRQGPALAGVVGHWSDTTAGTPAVVVNGEKWSGTTPKSELENASRRLFGSVNDTFLANMTSATVFPVAVVPQVSTFSSGTLRVQFNMFGGKSDQNAGIMFGLQPTGEYYYVRYNTKDGNVAVWRYANGDRAVLEHGHVHKQIPLGTWHELVVEIRGRRVRGYIAGDSTISVEHTLDTEPAGRVGLWVKRDAITGFRGYSVTPQDR